MPKKGGEVRNPGHAWERVLWMNESFCMLETEIQAWVLSVILTKYKASRRLAAAHQLLKEMEW